MTDSTFPAIVENQAGFTEVSEVLDWLTAEVARFKEQLASTGAVLFRGFPVSSPEDFDAFSAAFGYGDFTY